MQIKERGLRNTVLSAAAWIVLELGRQFYLVIPVGSPNYTYNLVHSMYYSLSEKSYNYFLSDKVLRNS